MQKLLALTTLALVASAPLAAQETWKIDGTHTEVSFEIPYMGISSVAGRFTDVKGTVLLDLERPEKSKIDVTIAAASIDTANETRDNHLRSGDFFAVDKFKTLTYKSKRITRKGSKLVVNGDLTMHGVTKEVVLTVKGPTGEVLNPAGSRVRGAKATGELDRTDFGLKWNKGLKKGAGLLVGNEVEITIRAVMMIPKKK